MILALSLLYILDSKHSIYSAVTTGSLSVFSCWGLHALHSLSVLFPKMDEQDTIPSVWDTFSSTYAMFLHYLTELGVASPDMWKKKTFSQTKASLLRLQNNPPPGRGSFNHPSHHSKMYVVRVWIIFSWLNVHLCQLWNSHRRAPGEELWEGGQLPSLTLPSDRSVPHVQHSLSFRTPTRTIHHWPVGWYARFGVATIPRGSTVTTESGSGGQLSGNVRFDRSAPLSALL